MFLLDFRSDKFCDNFRGNVAKDYGTNVLTSSTKRSFLPRKVNSCDKPSAGLKPRKTKETLSTAPVLCEYEKLR